MPAQPLSIHADRLGRLALTAATEIDAIQRGRSTNYVVVKEFIKEVFPTAASADDKNSGVRFDPAGSQMFSTALSRVSPKKPKDTDALYKEINSLFVLFNNIEEESADSTLSKLKDYCVGVYDALSVHRANSGLREQGVFDYEHMVRGQEIR